jgi:transposase-like protein
MLAATGTWSAGWDHQPWRGSTPARSPYRLRRQRSQRRRSVPPPARLVVGGPLADVQLCVVHLVRAAINYTSKKYWAQVCREMREICTAPSLEAAEARYAEFADTWRDKYPAMTATWESAWNDFVPFLDFPVELRQLVYTTNSIESLNSRFRKAVRHRGQFPTEQAALKVLYLTAIERRKNRSNPTGRINGWKQILNILTIHYGDRIEAASQQ